MNQERTMGPYGTNWDQIGSNRNQIWDQTGQKRDQMIPKCDQNGTKWNKKRQNGTKWNQMEQKGTKKDQMEPNRTTISPNCGIRKLANLPCMDYVFVDFRRNVIFKVSK